MFVQLGYGFTPAANFAGSTPAAAAQANAVAPQSPGQTHTTANSTNATAVSQTAGTGSPFASPQFSVPQFSVAQGAVGFVTPFGLVAGGGFVAGGFSGLGGFGGFGAVGGYGAQSQSAPVASAQPAAAATSANHQVSNPTNSLAAVGSNQESNAYGGANFGAPSAALPFILSPGFAQNGAPVILALPVFAFVFMAAPMQQAPLQQAPTQQPAVPEPTVAAPAEPAVPTAPDAVVAPVLVPVIAPPVTAPVIDVAPITTPTQPSPSVVVNTLTNAEFAKYEQEQISSELQTQLKLSLTTAEGDIITLDFSQLDVLQSNKLSGVDDSDKPLEDTSDSEEMERLVKMDVQGSLSADEQAAVDLLLEDITEVAQKFFSGSMNDAASMLRDLDFDTSQLAELSLKMSMTRTTEIRSGYREGMDQLDQLSSRGGEVMEMLDFMATEQRRLIDRAKDVFDDESAVRVVTSLIPALLEEPAALDALAKLDTSLDNLAPVA
jgi:hypothetical protein